MLEVYKKMYALFCSAVSDALDELPFIAENLTARLLLEKAIQGAEEIYIEYQNKE